MESGVGSAFVIQGASHFWVLPNAETVYTSEPCGMWHTLHFCEHQGERNSIIHTGSLSFLTALNNLGTVDLLLQQVMAICHALQDLGLSSNFVWCPGHVGIENNKGADATVRNAADSP